MDMAFDFGEPSHPLGEVESISYTQAAAYVERMHYLGKAGSTSHSYGLFQSGALVGVITFGTIITKNAAAICGEQYAGDVLELTRLVLIDDTPPFSESHFIAGSFRCLRRDRGATVLISYADSAAGHVGVVYQATNWLYTGFTTKGGYTAHDGTKLHARTVSDGRKGVNAATVGGLTWTPMEPKHRYVTFVGDKRQRRAMRAALRWPVLPYPKAVNA